MNQIVYVTKYALTAGICEMDAEIKPCEWSTKKKFSAYGQLSTNVYKTSYYNDDFYLTREEAIVDAESRRQRRITQLKKQLTKLEKLKF